MERNTITTVANLKPGDRFFKVNDKNKKVLQIVEHAPKKTHFRTYKIFCCLVQIIEGRLTPTAKEGYYSPILKDTQVVYLRSTSEVKI
jgi:hypothetical protein